MATAADAAAQLESFNKTRVNPEAALTTAESKYGVGALQTQLDSLRSLSSNLKRGVDNVDPSVTGRTQGSLVTEAQRSAIVNNERQPLVKQFNEVGGQIGDTSSQYQNATGLASNYSNTLMQNDSQKYSELFGQYTTLSEQERAAAQAAEQKRQFDIDQAEKQRQFNMSLAEQQAARKSAASSGSGLSLGGLGAGTSGTPAAPGISDHLQADIAQLIPRDYASRFLSGYTERTAIPKLQKLYPEIPPAQVAQMVYAYRKQITGT